MTHTPQRPPYKHLYLVDGSGYIYRAYYALPPISTSKGVPTNAAFGFTNMLVKLMRESPADAIAVIFDKGRRSFRNEIYPDYKAQRDEPPEDLVPQFSMVREATRAFNLPCIELEGYEADDLIASYARAATHQCLDVTIVSSDKDLMQLVGYGIAMYDPMKEKVIDTEAVWEKFGVPPQKVIDVQALAGDSIDNIPGVPGIGVKTAAQLIEEYGSLENLLDRAGEIKQPKRREKLLENIDMARLSKQLVTLKDDIDLPQPLSELGLKEPEPQDLKDFLEKYEFRSLLSRLSEKLGDLVPHEREKGEDTLTAEEKYVLVQNEADLEEWVDRAFELGLVAVDCETTSLDALVADLVGVSLALGPGDACYIPLAHKGRAKDGELDFDTTEDAPEQIPMEKALALLKPMLEDRAVLKIGQNIKYDLLVLGRYGINITPFDDTMLISYVLEGGLHGHGMDELAQLHLGRKTISFKDVAGSGRHQIRFDAVALDKALEYAAEDADVTWRLHDLLKPRLREQHLLSVYEHMERPLVEVLADMERHGVRVNKRALLGLSQDFGKKMAHLETQIYELAGRTFSIGSPKQLGEILFTEMGLESGRKGKSGSLSTGADILESLAAKGHDLPQRVLEWRQLSKLKSTYSDALQKQINPDTGRVHTSYSQAIASTGRLSSSEPNLQNIPARTEEGRKIRAAFIPQEGAELLSVDYSQIELRLTAHIADVDTLKEAFAEGQDIHALTASQVFGIPLRDIDAQTRRRAKAINFGIIYGMSPYGLAENLGIPQSEAKAYIEAYFERYPGIREYMEKTKEMARRQGYVESLFKRRIHIATIKDKNPARRNFGERAAINAPIQASAADIIKRAMIRVPPALLDANLRTRLLLQVHDELVLEVPIDEKEKAAAVVKDVMENACAPVLALSVPLVADIGYGDNWADAH